MSLITPIIFGFLLCASNCYANWDNPSERYAHAYKQYIQAPCPILQNDIKHFVYFARDRNALKDHPLLTHNRFSGAQIMYLWSKLEPTEGKYDFSAIQHDYDYLKKFGKKLFIQLQDATFNPKVRGVPEYLNTSEYDGGSIPQLNDFGKADGWSAKRWNNKVQNKFALLLAALGSAFDGKIEGLNLQETAIGVSPGRDPSFTYSGYRDAIKANMLSMRKAFTRSTPMQYANFMPGEWLPWEDKGYLRSIYEYGEKIGVALAAPDLMVKRKGQLNHALAMMHEHKYSTSLGIAVQDGNYVGLTGADFTQGSKLHGQENKIIEKRRNIVPLLHAFAADFMKVNYMFWVNQKPYFEEDVLTCFK